MGNDEMAELPDMTSRTVEGLAKHFRYFGEVECPRMQSRLYEEYSLGIADDADLLQLASQIDPGQPAPNIIFAAVQDLLFENSTASAEAAALVPFYPAISGQPIPDRPAWEAFRRFCLSHADSLGPKLRTGRTQTCVVHRCNLVLPTLAVLRQVEEMDGRIALLEIGPSAGLNLRLDCYRYEYGNGLSWGDPDARPILHCDVQGEMPPPLPGPLKVVARRGLDLHPLDLDDPMEIRWLRSLIWPEHAERARVMEAALDLAKRVPIEIEEGDATRTLAGQIERLPSDAARVVFATHVLYQISREGRLSLLGEIARASRRQPVDFVLVESTGQGDSQIDWFHFSEGKQKTRTALGRADSHGRWIEWGAPFVDGR